MSNNSQSFCPSLTMKYIQNTYSLSKTGIKQALDPLLKMMSNWILVSELHIHDLILNVKKVFHFLYNSFKVKYGEIQQISYDVMIVLAPDIHSGIIY